MSRNELVPTKGNRQQEPKAPPLRQSALPQQGLAAAWKKNEALEQQIAALQAELAGKQRVFDLAKPGARGETVHVTQHEVLEAEAIGRVNLLVEELDAERALRKEDALFATTSANKEAEAHREAVEEAHWLRSVESAKVLSFERAESALQQEEEAQATNRQSESEELLELARTVAELAAEREALEHGLQLQEAILDSELSAAQRDREEAQENAAKIHAVLKQTETRDDNDPAEQRVQVLSAQLAMLESQESGQADAVQRHAERLSNFEQAAAEQRDELQRGEEKALLTLQSNLDTDYLRQVQQAELEARDRAREDHQEAYRQLCLELDLARSHARDEEAMAADQAQAEVETALREQEELFETEACVMAGRVTEKVEAWEAFQEEQWASRERRGESAEARHARDGSSTPPTPNSWGSETGFSGNHGQGLPQRLHHGATASRSLREPPRTDDMLPAMIVPVTPAQAPRPRKFVMLGADPPPGLEPSIKTAEISLHDPRIVGASLKARTGVGAGWNTYMKSVIQQALPIAGPTAKTMMREGKIVRGTPGGTLGAAAMGRIDSLLEAGKATRGSPPPPPPSGSDPWSVPLPKKTKRRRRRHDDDAESSDEDDVETYALDATTKLHSNHRPPELKELMRAHMPSGGPLRRLAYMREVELEWREQVNRCHLNYGGLFMDWVFRVARAAWMQFVLNSPDTVNMDYFGQALDDNGVVIPQQGDRLSCWYPNQAHPCNFCQCCVRCFLEVELRSLILKFVPEGIGKAAQRLCEGNYPRSYAIWYVYLCSVFQKTQADFLASTEEMRTFTKETGETITDAICRLRRYQVVMGDWGFSFPDASFVMKNALLWVKPGINRLKASQDLATQEAAERLKDWSRQQYLSRVVGNRYDLIDVYLRRVETDLNNYPPTTKEQAAEKAAGPKPADDSGRRKAHVATTIKRCPAGTDPSQVQCFICKDFGHFSFECPKADKDGSKKPGTKPKAKPGAKPKWTAKAAYQELQEEMAKRFAEFAKSKPGGKFGGGKQTGAKPGPSKHAGKYKAKPCPHGTSCKFGPKECWFGHEAGQAGPAAKVAVPAVPPKPQEFTFEAPSKALAKKARRAAQEVLDEARAAQEARQVRNEEAQAEKKEAKAAKGKGKGKGKAKGQAKSAVMPVECDSDESADFNPGPYGFIDFTEIPSHSGLRAAVDTAPRPKTAGSDDPKEPGGTAIKHRLSLCRAFAPPLPCDHQFPDKGLRARSDLGTCCTPKKQLKEACCFPGCGQEPTINCWYTEWNGPECDHRMCEDHVWSVHTDAYHVNVCGCCRELLRNPKGIQVEPTHEDLAQVYPVHTDVPDVEAEELWVECCNCEQIGRAWEDDLQRCCNMFCNHWTCEDCGTEVVVAPRDGAPHERPPGEEIWSLLCIHCAWAAARRRAPRPLGRTVETEPDSEGGGRPLRRTGELFTWDPGEGDVHPVTRWVDDVGFARKAFPAKRSARQGKKGAGSYAWDTGASDVHGQPLAGDYVVSSVPVNCAGGGTRSFELSQHAECKVERGDGLLPAVQMSAKGVIGTFLIQGRPAPLVADLSSEDNTFLEGWILGRGGKALEVENNVPYVDEDMAKELRLKLRERRVARTAHEARTLKGIPPIIDRFYEWEYKPAFIPQLMREFEPSLHPGLRKLLNWWYKKATHVCVQSDPEFVTMPRKHVARSKHLAVPTKWVDQRIVIVFSRTQGPEPEVQDYKPVVMLSLPFAKHAIRLVDADKQIEATKSANLSLLVLTLFKSNAQDSEQAEVEPANEAGGEHRPESGSGGVSKPRGNVRTPGHVEFETPAKDLRTTNDRRDDRERPSGPEEFILSPDAEEQSKSQGEPSVCNLYEEHDWGALRAARVAKEIKAVETDFTSACSRLGMELGGEDCRPAWVICACCESEGWAEPVLGKKHMLLTPEIRKEADERRRKDLARVLPACDDQHIHETTGCVSSSATCGNCQQAHLRAIGRTRGRMRCQIGDFSVDLLIRLTEQSNIQVMLVLVGYRRDPERQVDKLWTIVAVDLEEKTSEAIYGGVMRALLQAEYLWQSEPIRRIHSDREPGLLPVIPKIREHAINVTLTEGHASNANPAAEAGIRRITEFGKAALLRAVRNIDKSGGARSSARGYLWHFSILYASMYLTAYFQELAYVTQKVEEEKLSKKKKRKSKDPKKMLKVFYRTPSADQGGRDITKVNFNFELDACTIPKGESGRMRLTTQDFCQFGERVLYRAGHSAKPDKEEATARLGWYLHPSADIPRGSVVMDEETGETKFSCTVRPFNSKKEAVFPTTLTLPALQRDPSLGPGWDPDVWCVVPCGKCRKWRYCEIVIAEQRDWVRTEKDGGSPFQCAMLDDGTTCRTAELKTVWDRDDSRKKSGKDVPRTRNPRKRAANDEPKEAERLPVAEPTGPAAGAGAPAGAARPDPNRAVTRSQTKRDGKVGASRTAKLARVLLGKEDSTGEWVSSLNPDMQEALLSWADEAEAKLQEPDWFMRSAQQALLNWDSETDVMFGTDPVESGREDPEPIEVPVQWSCENDKGEEIIEEGAGAQEWCANLCERRAQRASSGIAGEIARMDADIADAQDLPVYRRQAGVVKVLSIKEAKERDKYAATVAAELGRHMEFSTYGKPVAKSLTPRSSVFYRGKLIYGVKNWETPEARKDKARMVIQGCIRVTREGRVLLEKHFKKPGEFWAPNSSMAGLRLVCSVGAIYGHGVDTIDLDCAYLQSEAREPNRFLIFPPEVLESMPDDWQDLIRKAIEQDLANGGAGEVVFPQLKNIYGKSDAGTNFIQDFQSTLEYFGWCRLPHCHGTFLRFCPTTGKAMVLANYVDDLAVTLTAESAALVWKEIAEHWQFTPARPLEKFLGIVCKTFPEHGHRMLELDQTDLMLKIVADYEKAVPGVLIKSLSTLPDKVPALVDMETGEVLEESTPLVTDEDQLQKKFSSMELDPEDQRSLGKHRANVATTTHTGTSNSTDSQGWLPTSSPLSEVWPVPPYLQLNPELPYQEAKLALKKGAVKPKGEAGTICRSAVGALFYAARGTRPDVMKAVHELARRVTKWTKECDAFLERILAYCKGSKVALVLDARGLSTDLVDWTVDLSTDARYHAPYSTTGILITLAPVNPAQERFLALDWTSHAQRYVKLNVAECEVVSAVHGMRSGLRYQSSWSMISGASWDWALAGEPPRPCDVMHQRQDNTACILQLNRGWSEKLSLLPILYGVSAEWAAERIREGRVKLEHERTNLMLADPLTKMTAPTVLFSRGILRTLGG